MSQTDGEPGGKPSPRAAFSNWKMYEAPFADKVRMVLSNNLLKVRKKQSCCGNHGQPGC